MATDPLTRVQLDVMICADPACLQIGHVHPHLVMRTQCHPGLPQIVRYWGDGVVELRCKICNKFVISVAISDEDQVSLNAKIACNDPVCKHPRGGHQLLLVPPCHKGAGMFVIYNSGTLKFACARCRKPVSGVNVREGTVN